MLGENFDLEPQITEKDLEGLFYDEHNENVNQNALQIKQKPNHDFWSDNQNKKQKAHLYSKLIPVLIILAVIAWGTFYGFRQSSMGKTVSLWKLIKDGKYLVLFQNNAELRATGGFLGSFAVVTLENAKTKDLYFETNIYKRDRTLTDKINLDPPQPLKQFIGQGWAMRDSNNAVDFPESAKTVQWFFKEEGGYQVDGVVAIDTTMMEDLLQLAGPIEMPEYNTTLNRDNFRSVVQYKVEKEYFQSEEGKEENEPKTILRDMLPKLIERVEKIDKKELMSLALTELQEKHLLFYFNNPVAEKIILEKNWGGEVKSIADNEDYLYANNSNFNGKKSSLSMIEDIRLNAEVGRDGEIINDLTITRTHTGSMNWPDGVNNNYIRVLVPEGSKLISSSLDGQDHWKKIDFLKEADKTVFGTWINTAPQTSHVLRLKYRLPFKLKTNRQYQIYVQKQPGTIGDDLEVSAGNKILYGGKLETDKKIIDN